MQDDSCWVCAWTARYDERGNRTERTFFDQTGKPRSGWARERASYDNRSNKKEVSYWSADDKLTLFKDGYARATYTYDDFDSRVDAAYFDREGRPVQTQAVIVRVTTGMQGQVLKVGDILETYDGKPVVNWARFIHTRQAEREGDPPRQLVVLREGKRLSFTFRPGDLGVDMEDRVLPRPAQP